MKPIIHTANLWRQILPIIVIGPSSIGCRFFSRTNPGSVCHELMGERLFGGVLEIAGVVRVSWFGVEYLHVSHVSGLNWSWFQVTSCWQRFAKVTKFWIQLLFRLFAISTLCSSRTTPDHTQPVLQPRFYNNTTLIYYPDLLQQYNVDTLPWPTTTTQCWYTTLAYYNNTMLIHYPGLLQQHNVDTLPWPTTTTQCWYTTLAYYNNTMLIHYPGLLSHLTCCQLNTFGTFWIAVSVRMFHHQTPLLTCRKHSGKSGKLSHSRILDVWCIPHVPCEDESQHLSKPSVTTQDVACAL